MKLLAPDGDDTTSLQAPLLSGTRSLTSNWATAAFLIAATYLPSDCFVRREGGLCLLQETDLTH